MTVPVVSFVGRSGSGKTTFLERLIPVLQERGYRVGCIKHDAHQFEVDYPGKDSWRLRQAGSQWVALASDAQVAVMGRVAHPPTLDALIACFPEAVDLVLTEGYRQAGKPRIEVVRMARSPHPLVPPEELLALVTDGGFDGPCPTFALDDVEGVADLIEQRFLSRRPVPGTREPPPAEQHPHPRPPVLTDAHGRPITYLRVSLTDRCNMRCRYCVPSEHRPLTPPSEHLTNAELVRVIQAAAAVGISKIRLTGGEPTLRAGLVELVRAIKALPGIEYLTMSTNGVLLPRLAAPLRAAGLDRVNISLDTLLPEKMRWLTGGDVQQVWAGIEAAAANGLHPVRLNTVVLRGVNDDELLDFAALTLRSPWEVRFIEMMPMTGMVELARAQLVGGKELLRRIEAVYGPLEPLPDTPGNSARSYRIPGASGRLGFISSVTEPFCDSCNRVRLTASGHIHLCLLHNDEVDLRAAVRAGATQQELEELFRLAVWRKPWGHGLAQGEVPTLRRMVELGG
jgi:GTP 3',8-cyclase